MPNMSKRHLDREQQHFIDSLAALLTPWGMPITVARIYGYLLLRAGPASLDDIAREMELSKSSASVAARVLERYNLAQRHGERGTKRIYYSASDDCAGFLSAQSTLLGAMGQLFQEHAASASGGAKKRLKDIARFYLSMRQGMEAALEEFEIKPAGAKAKRPKAQAATARKSRCA